MGCIASEGTATSGDSQYEIASLRECVIRPTLRWGRLLLLLLMHLLLAIGILAIRVVVRIELPLALFIIISLAGIADLPVLIIVILVLLRIGIVVSLICCTSISPVQGIIVHPRPAPYCCCWLHWYAIRPCTDWRPAGQSTGPTQGTLARVSRQTQSAGHDRQTIVAGRDTKTAGAGAVGAVSGLSRQPTVDPREEDTAHRIARQKRAPEFLLQRPAVSVAATASSDKGDDDAVFVHARLWARSATSKNTNLVGGVPEWLMPTDAENVCQRTIY